VAQRQEWGEVDRSTPEMKNERWRGLAVLLIHSALFAFPWLNLNNCLRYSMSLAPMIELFPLALLSVAATVIGVRAALLRRLPLSLASLGVHAAALALAGWVFPSYALLSMPCVSHDRFVSEPLVMGEVTLRLVLDDPFSKAHTERLRVTTNAGTREIQARILGRELGGLLTPLDPASLVDAQLVGQTLVVKTREAYGSGEIRVQLDEGPRRVPSP